MPYKNACLCRCYSVTAVFVYLAVVAQQWVYMSQYLWQVGPCSLMFWLVQWSSGTWSDGLLNVFHCGLAGWYKHMFQTCFLHTVSMNWPVCLTYFSTFTWNAVDCPDFQLWNWLCLNGNKICETVVKWIICNCKNLFFIIFAIILELAESKFGLSWNIVNVSYHKH